MAERVRAVLSAVGGWLLQPISRRDRLLASLILATMVAIRLQDWWGSRDFWDGFSALALTALAIHQLYLAQK